MVECLPVGRLRQKRVYGENSADPEDVIAELRRLQPELEGRGVAHVFLFGSLDRSEDTDGSDIDIAVVLRLDFVGIELFLDERLGRKVD